MRRSLVLAAAIGSLALTGLLAFQHAHPRRVQAQWDQEIKVGGVLVASRELRDPNFFETTVVVANYGEQGVLGLILNRQTDVPISRALDKWRGAKGRSEPVFIGGPVERSAVLGLVRTLGSSSHGMKIVKDVQLIMDRAELSKALAPDASPARVRIYFGYAGWGPTQLENEIEDGAWHIFPPDPNILFDSEPDSLWSRLIKKTETQIARSLPKADTTARFFSRGGL